MDRIVSVVSARPNFVKLAALHHAVGAGGTRPPGAPFAHLIVHTGQHYDPLLSDVFFAQLGIPPPERNLNVHGGAREEVIEKTERALGAILPTLKPAVLLVYGDVNGALGAARAAKRSGIRLGHVEAGLRSLDATMPEELNRVEIDSLADLHFVSERSGIENLRREGVRGEAHFVGNTMIDTLLRMRPFIERERFPLSLERPFGVVTLHRPSNVDDPAVLVRNLQFLGEVARRVPLVLPVHHRLRARLRQFQLEGSVQSRIMLTEPVGYIPFLRLVMEAALLLTDSGGLQEEAVLLGKRCFTLRRNTERPATLDSGSNVLVDPAQDEDRDAVLRYAEDPRPPAVAIPPLWDGRAGERIVGIVRRLGRPDGEAQVELRVERGR